MAASEKKPRKAGKPLPRTPVRPKVITKYVTPHEAAQWLVEDFRKRRMAGDAGPVMADSKADPLVPAGG